MATAKVLDASGAVVEERRLPEDLFGGEVNRAVLHQTAVAQLAAARSGAASTKTRSEVRGGGHKPWRQKGTGRARHGSIRSPIWTGGGVVFGPKPRSYTQRLPKKMRRAALRSALADKANEGRLWILGGFGEPKTRAAAGLLSNAGLTGRTLVIVDPADAATETVERGFQNLPRVSLSLHSSIGTHDVLVADDVLFTVGALDSYVTAFGGDD